MGGSTQQSSQQQSTTSNQTDPALLAMLQGNYSTAQTNAAKLSTPYNGQLTAGFTPTQTQAQGVLTGVATDPTYGATNNAALSSVGRILGASPNTTVTGQPVAASTIANSDLSQYENPYTSDVVNASIASNERARQIAQNADTSEATAEGAFGGSRSGVMGAQTNQLYDQNDQANIANLNSANFTQAQNAAATDAATNNQVGEFNSGQNVNAQQSSIANTQAQQNIGLTAANDLTTLNNNALNDAATQGSILGAVGDTQQAQDQTELTNAYQAWITGQGLTVQQQQLLNSALGLMPNEQTTTGNSTGNSTTTTSPGIGGILGSLGSLGMGLGKSGLGLTLSDMRTKDDVQPIGTDSRGRNWYSFRYNWEPAGTVHRGVIAQELLSTQPDAVMLGDDGLYRVDYSMLMVTR